MFAASSTSDGAPDSASITVKAVYFQMSQIVDVHQECIAVKPPATVGEFLQMVTSRHPVLAGMMPNMMILVNGSASKVDTPLKDGDEIDFVPAFAGG
ncbi:MAG: MoaD/ThiS family protein [Nitrososphaerota archaeon]|nr:MoaD/ThiS family protein [Nitrososphaerota archaeon]